MGNHKQRAGVNDIVDSRRAERAACAARDRPDVKRWVRRLKRLLRDMPDGLEMFVGDSVTVLATGPAREHFMTVYGGKDTAAVVDSVTDGRWDGGGW